MLVSEQIYCYLLDWLCPAMEAEYKRLYSKGKDGGKLRGLGKYDKNVYQGRVDRLRAIVISNPTQSVSMATTLPLMLLALPTATARE